MMIQTNTEPYLALPGSENPITRRLSRKIMKTCLYLVLYRDLLIVLPMREPSIFRGIAVSLLRPVIGSNVEIDVVALNWVASRLRPIRNIFSPN